MQRREDLWNRYLQRLSQGEPSGKPDEDSDLRSQQE